SDGDDDSDTALPCGSDSDSDIDEYVSDTDDSGSSEEPLRHLNSATSKRQFKAKAKAMGRGLDGLDSIFAGHRDAEPLLLEWENHYPDEFQALQDRVFKHTDFVDAQEYFALEDELHEQCSK
ncbi:hypothetical protein EV174_007129, partial [Coemansia sp. RSA 2320]